MVLLLRPRIRKEHIHRAHMMGRQEIVERIKRLKPQYAHVVKPAAAALAVKEPHSAKHPLDSEKIAFGMRLGAIGKKPPFPAPDLNFKRPGKIELKRDARVLYLNNVIHNIQFSPSE